MLPYLDPTTEFPDVNDALTDPNGLLAAGADLSSSRLLDAYSKGIFPWYSEDEPILWWSPNPRMVFEITKYLPSKSLIRLVKKNKYKVTLNKDFDAVINECAAPRNNQSGTWITEEVKTAYCAMHALGHAHSVEVWDTKGVLVGGIYGVVIGKLFCGESMFSQVSNGSKIALSTLIGYLKQHHFPILDCQVKNEHLVSLGATEISRIEYTNRINKLIHIKSQPEIWKGKQLDPNQLITRNQYQFILEK